MRKKHKRPSDSNMKNKGKRASDSPWKLSFEVIKRITNNFSEELGRGAFGQVFKGVLEDEEEVAVKMLHFMPNINDQQFENEFQILKRLKHPNIVRLVGFCDEAEEELVEYNGKLTVCQRIHRALCLEYMANGSLGKLLSVEKLGKNWPIRYQIIKGMCKGLKYLQEGLEFPIFHFDLKPDNILLNAKMKPKISDFGLSRLIGEENSKKTLTPLGTIGYLLPEFINYQVISKEYDIYSLGVIITKIITGITGYSDVADMGAEEFVEHVHEKWKKCLQEIPRYASLEVDCKQVKRCIEIARRCMESDRHKRPTIKDIMSQLDEIGNFKLDSQLTMDKAKRCRRYSNDCSVGCRRLTCASPPGLFEPACRSDDSASAYHMEDQSRSEKQKCGDPPSEICHPAHSWDITAAPEQEPLLVPRPEQQPIRRFTTPKLCRSSKDPPSEISHPAHPEHKLKLMTAAAGGPPFLCDGCKEPGYGPRCTCDYIGGGQSLFLHTRCALAGNPLFDLHTVVLPLFGYGKQFEFSFLHEAPPPPSSSSSSVQDEAGSRTTRVVCDACGEATRGFVYHCSEQDVVIHPCCASLPDRILHDGRAFDLHRRASRPCALCPEDDEGNHRRWFWAYRCYVVDGDEAAVDLHLACLKETARRSWDWEASNNQNQDDDVGGGGAMSNVDSMLEDRFGEAAGTVASFLRALVFAFF